MTPALFYDSQWAPNLFANVWKFSFCRVVAKLEEKSPDQVEVFKTNCNTVMKEILGRFKDLQFFTGESMDCDGMIAMLEYRDIDGGSVPILMCFKHGLEEEKF